MAERDWKVPAKRLEAGFEDKKPAFDAGEALTEASRCLYCYDAPCIPACPTAIDIPTFIRKIGTDNLRGSARTILESNLLGRSCSQVCPVEVLCEGACVYTGWGRKPIEIGRLQRFAMESAQSPDLLPRQPATGHKIALVGAGPASLACAGTLVQMGHEAVVFERDALPGGLNMTGVAPYKFRAESTLAEVEFIRSLGVEIRTGVEIGRDFTAEQLLEDYDAVFLGVGLGSDSLRGIPAIEGTGVIGAVQWIRGMKLDPATSVDGVGHAIVVGGGNTALDVVQELATLGVPSVHMVYRRGLADMSGYAHEFKNARNVGVRAVEHATPAKLEWRDGRLVGVSLESTQSPASFESRDMPCDLLVVATGQGRLRDLVEQFPQVECDQSGRVVAEPESLVTGNPRVFTGGDCYNGGKEVVNAAAEGQRAARAIDELLRQG